jgi:hypothetical protein
MGFYGQYWDGTKFIYRGFYSDVSASGLWRLFEGLEVAPNESTGVINPLATGFTYASLQLNDLTAEGDLLVNGATTILNSTYISMRDNFIVANNGPYLTMKQDNGWCGVRLPLQVNANDTPTTANIALNTNYTAAALTIIIDALAVGNGYYVGWYLRDDTNNELARILTDTDNTGNHTFTLDVGFTNAGTAGVNTYSLFKKRLVGLIWDESKTELSAFGFPREDGLNILDPSATDGSAPDYMNMHVNNLTVDGTLTVAGPVMLMPNPVPTKTITTTQTLTTLDITDYSIIYANPAANIVVTLPLLSSLTLVNYAYRITIVNVSSFRVTISGNGTDLIEGVGAFILKKRWDKQTLVTTPFLTNWYIQ